MSKWIVGVNIVGYMPDSEPCVFDTKREAIKYASETAREILADKNEYDDPEGRTWRKEGSRGDYYIGCNGPYTLATHVWVDQISDEEAAEYSEY